MERAVAALCAATSGQLQNRVLAFNRGRRTVREELSGIPVTRVGSVSAARSTPIAPVFARELRRTDADLIVLHEPNPWALATAAMVRPRPPLVIWFHSEVVRPRLQYALFYQPLVSAVYSRACRFVVSSLALARQASALHPYQDRVSIIPFGIETEEWSETPGVCARAQQLREAAGSRPVVLFTGRMVAYKGVDVLLRALVQVDAFAWLAGEGPLRSQWQLLARELGIADRVAFAGEVPREELRALYRAADVFVLPSISSQETFGYVQLEAMASGTPLVSTRLPTGVPWVNQDGVTGVTVAPGDPRALAAALNQVLGNPGLRARMGAAAAARVQSEFSLETMGERAVSLFERLAVGHGMLV